jgi:hypothetical protein
MVNNPEAGLQNVRPQKGVTDERFAMRRELARALDAEFQRQVGHAKREGLCRHV